MKKFIVSIAIFFLSSACTTTQKVVGKPVQRQVGVVLDIECDNTPGGECDQHIAREEQRQDLVPPTIVQPVEEKRPAWVAPVVTVVAGVVGAAAFAAVDVVAHQLTDKRVRPGEVFALGATGGVLAAGTSILAFSW